MEKFMQRENVYVGYAPQGFSGNSPKSPNSEDLDFNDVFGGPPRRFSMQEVRARYSFGETVESEEERASSPWSSLKEKPVFGDESVPRRRHQGDDFFNDIFKGGDQSYSSPRRTDRDRDNIFGSNPGSRIMSPARPLPPKADPFGTSVPAQFSLPAKLTKAMEYPKLTKAMEYPTFGSHNHGQYKVDGSTNGLNSPHSSSPLSRFSNQAIRGRDEIGNEVHPVPHQSPLSYEASFISEDSPSIVTCDQKDNIENLKKDMRSVDSVGNQFHFSIYKWAGRGVPMLMPLMSGNNFRSKDKRKYDRSASSNGRMESKSSILREQSLSAAKPESLRTERMEEDFRSKEEIKELQNSVAEALYVFLESKSQSSLNDSVVLDGARQSVKEEQVKSLEESDVREKIENEVPVKIRECLESELKPLHAFLDEGERPGNFTEMKDKKTRTPGVHADADDSKNVKKNEGIGIDSKNTKVKKSSLQGMAINLGVTQGKRVAKGKVKEFVQIFNQDEDSRPKAYVQRSRSSRWRNIGIDQKENEVSSNATEAKEQVNLHNVDKKPDVSFKGDENLNNDEAQHYSPTKTPSYTSNHSSCNPQKAFSSETLHMDSKISEENSDDPLEDNFLVQELSDGHENVTQSESSEDTKAIDAKIRQWSVGKKGNIRSLLSTLQYILWPESGWKPVPLVDLIEANSVKRAYQKALLRLHPDKLQQKGAAFHQKYIAEKVFDILQEAWDHFNACSSLTV